jgi:hypothetical protein
LYFNLANPLSGIACQEFKTVDLSSSDFYGALGALLTVTTYRTPFASRRVLHEFLYVCEREQFLRVLCQLWKRIVDFSPKDGLWKLYLKRLAP